MLSLNSVTYLIGERPIFLNTTYSFQCKKIGLVGPNGVGKTTLAMLLAGKLVPDSGLISTQGSVVYFAQSESRAVDLTVADYLNDIWSTIEPYVYEFISKIDFDRTLLNLSGGEWMKVRLVKTLSQGCDFLILDEPTNDLDLKTRDELYKWIEKLSCGLLVISHDRKLLRQMEKIVELSNQGLSTFGGNFDFYLEERGRERTRHEHELEQSKREKKKCESARVQKIDQQEKRTRVAAKKAPDMGLSRISIGVRKRRAENTMGRLKVQENEIVDLASIKEAQLWSQSKRDPFLRLDFEGASVGPNRLLIDAKDFNFQFIDEETTLWPMPLSFQLWGPTRLQILGSNGSGKSTLLKLLQRMNLNGKLSGRLELRTDRVVYLDQQYSLLDPKVSVFENIIFSSRFNTIELRNELAFYGFTGDMVHQPIRTLSGGETLKAALAKLFLSTTIPELLILDEPTNNLDLQSLELLTRALQKFKGAIVFVSHDEEFAKTLEASTSLTLLPK